MSSQMKLYKILFFSFRFIKISFQRHISPIFWSHLVVIFKHGSIILSFYYGTFIIILEKIRRKFLILSFDHSIYETFLSIHNLTRFNIFTSTPRNTDPSTFFLIQTGI